MKAMLKLFIAVLMTGVCSLGYAQDKQWDMYNRIPTLKSIDLRFDRDALKLNGGDWRSGEDLHLTIYSDYTVKVTCGVNRMALNQSTSTIDYYLSGSGSLVIPSTQGLDSL